MSSTRRSIGRVLTAVALVAAASSIAPAAHASTLAGSCPGLPAEGELTIDQLPSDLVTDECNLVGRIVVHGDVGVAIPSPGEGVAVSPLASGDSDHQGFSLKVAADGKFDYALEGQSSSSASARATSAACSDGTFALNDYEMLNTYNWYVGDGAMPAAQSQSDAATLFADAINNITAGYNDCGIADTIDAYSDYIGTTTYESDINSSSQCTTRDGQSTWDAGDLANGHLAINCTWTTTGGSGTTYAIESDVRYNTTDYDFTKNPTSTCNNQWDLRAVGTHEAGHAYGLGHAPLSPDLTMNEAIAPCSTAYRTLGLGDMKGLEFIY